MKYLPRIVDAELADRLAATGAVVVEGPKACGKTATAESVAASAVFLDVDDAARAMVDLDPAAVLAGETPRLVDEWQTEPAIWNHIRRAVDRRSVPGQFILTGSAVPADDVTRHTGAGRLTRLRMRPMSLFETGRSTGEMSLAGLLAGSPQRSARSHIAVQELTELVCAGGWPGNQSRSLAQAVRANRDYLSEVQRVEVQRLEDKRRDPVKVGRLLRSLARNIATPATVATLARDVRGTGPSFKASTAAEYMEALERLMIVEDQPAWSPHLRFPDHAANHACPALRGSVAGGGRVEGHAASVAGRPGSARSPVRVHGDPGPAGLRPGRRRPSVPLPREGRPGGGRHRRRRRGKVGGVRSEDGRAAGQGRDGQPGEGRGPHEGQQRLRRARRSRRRRPQRLRRSSAGARGGSPVGGAGAVTEADGTLPRKQGRVVSPRPRPYVDQVSTDLHVHADIRKAETLPGRIYHSERAYRLQRERVFAPAWHFVADLNRLKAPGHVLPVELLPGCLDEPVVVTRDRAGALHCLSNVCTHRGAIVVEGEGHANTLKCRYHGRRFALDGAFRSMSEFDGAEGFPRPCDDLPRLATGQWGPFLFACMDPAPKPPFDEWIGAVRERCAWMPLDQARFDPAGVRAYLIDANWALYCDNYLEEFHIPYIHADSLAGLDYGAYRTECFAWSNLQFGVAAKGEPAFELPAGHPDHGQRMAAYYFWLFPNLMLNFYPWGISVNVVTPLGKDRTRVQFLPFVWDESMRDRGAGADLHRVEMEDEEVVESQHRGLGSRLYRRGRFSPRREAGTHHFHRLLAEAMGAEIEPPGA